MAPWRRMIQSQAGGETTAGQGKGGGMRKWIILGVLVVTLGVAGAFALANLNTYLNNNREWIASQAETVLGRRVSFEEIGVSVFGGVGARLVDLRIADDPRFSSEDFIRAGQVRVTVKIIPALFGRYEVSRFILEKPIVNVIQTADGFNFDSIGNTGAAGTGDTGMAGGDAPAGAGAPREPGEAGAEALPLLVAAMRIADGEVHFVDRTAGGPDAAALTIRRLDFEASNVSLTAPVDIELRAAVLDGDDRNLSVEGTVGPVGASMDVDAIPVRAAVDVGPLDVDALLAAVPALAAQLPPGLGLSGPVRVRATFSGSPAALTVSDLDVGATVFGAAERNLTLSGTVGPVSAAGAAPDLQVDLRLGLGPVVIDDMKRLEAVAAAVPAEFSASRPVRLDASVKGPIDRLGLQLTFRGDEAEMRYGSTFVKPAGVPLQLALTATRKDGAVDVEALKLTLSTLQALVTGQVTVDEPQAVDLQLKVSPTALAGWDALLPAMAGYDLSGVIEAALATKGRLGGEKLPAVTGTVSFRDVGAQLEDTPQRIDDLSGTVQLTGTGLVLPPTKFTVGGSPAELRATIEPLDAPVVQFAFSSPALRAAAIGAADPAAGDDEVFRNLAVEGTLRTAGETPQFRGTIRSPAGRLRRVDYQEMAVDLGLQNDVATLESASVRAFGGTATASGKYDMRNAASPAFDLRSKVAAVQVQQALGSWFPENAGRIEGALHADLTLKGSGDRWEVIQQTLTGQGRAEVTDGALKGVNVAEGVLGGVSGLPGLAVLVPPKVRKKHADLFTNHDTTFDKLGGSVQIADGGATTDDLEVTARDFTMRGRGRFTFDSRVDFTATLFLSPALSSDVIDDVHAAKYLANAQGRLEIPFRMSGVLPDVRPVPDMRVVSKALSGALVEQGIGKLLGIEGAPGGGGGAAANQNAATAQEQKNPKQKKQKKKKQGLQLDDLQLEKLF